MIWRVWFTDSRAFRDFLNLLSICERPVSWLHERRKDNETFVEEKNMAMDLFGFVRRWAKTQLCQELAL